MGALGFARRACWTENKLWGHNYESGRLRRVCNQRRRFMGGRMERINLARLDSPWADDRRQSDCVGLGNGKVLCAAVNVNNKVSSIVGP